jgi:hypothetical protein
VELALSLSTQFSLQFEKPSPSNQFDKMYLVRWTFHADDPTFGGGGSDASDTITEIITAIINIFSG